MSTFTTIFNIALIKSTFLLGKDATSQTELCVIGARQNLVLILET